MNSRITDDHKYVTLVVVTISSFFPRYGLSPNMTDQMSLNTSNTTSATSGADIVDPSGALGFFIVAQSLDIFFSFQPSTAAGYLNFSPYSHFNCFI